MEERLSGVRHPLSMVCPLSSLSPMSPLNPLKAAFHPHSEVYLEEVHRYRAALLIGSRVPPRIPGIALSGHRRVRLLMGDDIFNIRLLEDNSRIPAVCHFQHESGTKHRGYRQAVRLLQIREALIEPHGKTLHLNPQTSVEVTDQGVHQKTTKSCGTLTTCYVFSLTP